MEQVKATSIANGFACGVFDIFHIGHVLMLEECRAHCDYLVVGVNTATSIDASINPNKIGPIFTLDARVKVLESCRFVDEVITYESEEELLKLLDSGKFHVRFLGDDYRGKPITEGSINIPIHYIDRSHGWSTSKLKELIIATND